MYNKILSKKMIMVLRLCLLGKFLLTMWSQKYVFDHCNQSMGSGPNWKQNMSANFLQEKDLYVNRLESVIFSTEMCILCQIRTYWKVGLHGTEIKLLKFKTEIYQPTEFKEQIRKMGSFVSLFLLPELCSLKCQKWPILCTFKKSV